MEKLISTAEAHRILTQKAFEYRRVVRQSFQGALGLVLAEAIVADRAYPPYRRATMDGIALRSSDCALLSSKGLPIAWTQMAGKPLPPSMLPEGACVRLYTGAVVPAEADVVLRQEDCIEVSTDVVRSSAVPTKGQNIHELGSDLQEATLYADMGYVLSSKELAALASFGYAEVLAYQKPRVVVLSLGDELVSIAQKPILPHQIRLSNAYAVGWLLQEWGFEVQIQENALSDDLNTISKTFEHLSGIYDVVVTTGGVSVGAADFVKNALKRIGASILLHGVAQKPGKPLLVAEMRASGRQSLFFGLPGNPVSAYCCALRYVLPFLRLASAYKIQEPQRVELAQQIVFNPALTYFLPARLVEGLAWPMATNTSGDLFSLGRAEGLLELPALQTIFKKEATCLFYPFKEQG